MKTVIDGISYDTEQAEQVAAYEAMFSHIDPRNENTYLYRTPEGRWFLAGEGGSETRWGRYIGSVLCNGKGVKAISEQEARDWCRAYSADSPVVQRYFPD